MFKRMASETRTGVFLVLALALLPALVYLNSLPNSFHYDDFFYIVGNQYIHDLSNIPHFFLSPRLISNIPLSGYRPVTMTTFALNYASGGPNPFVYHLTNVLIHMLNTLLVFGVALGLMRVFRGPHQLYAAAAAAAIFACHPLNTQAVNYISARSTLLVGAFSLACVLLYVWRYELREGQKERFLLIGSAAAYAGALLSKEEAVAIPGILAFFELCRLRPPFEKDRLKQVMLSLVPFFALTLAFLVFVIYGLGIVEDTPQARNIEQNLLTQAKSLFIYLRMTVLPVNLSVDHVVPVSTSLFEPLTFVSVAMLLVVLAGSLALVYADPLVAFGIWWFILTLVPTSTLIALKLVVNEQRMYFAVVGLLLAAVAGVAAALKKWEEAGLTRRRNYAAALLAIVIICFSGMTIHRNTYWREPLTLWLDALEQYPNSLRANTMVAKLYLDQDKPAEALPMAERAVYLAPDVIETHMVLARAYSRLGRNEDALEEARAAVDLNPVSSEAQALLGVTYARLERYAEAKKAWEQALELDPENSEARENLQKLREMIGTENVSRD
jgi:tetratricopeptide (TPR) repeat protein